MRRRAATMGALLVVKVLGWFLLQCRLAVLVSVGVRFCGRDNWIPYCFIGDWTGSHRCDCQ